MFVSIEKNCLYVYVSKKCGKYVKTAKKEGTVDLGGTKQSIQENKNENLEGKELHSVYFQIHWV